MPVLSSAEGSFSRIYPSAVTVRNGLRVQSDLEQLIAVIPDLIRARLTARPELEELLEVVMDLGRPPEARFGSGMFLLDERPVAAEDIDYVLERIGPFSGDNRAGIERTLHRISAIRNRQGDVVGLTLRVGRAVFGTIDIIRDIVETGKSLLMLGRPGIGKTTKLREIARVLADEFGKRVVVVDTSNEIGGDGDIPHPAIGRARRMQVPTPQAQHAVMIEAVENHMPEVIVIDEIGTEAEAMAARTIAERGVQLIGTAHGNTVDNLLMNPTLCDLVGGIEAVTLGDEEARRRGTQKTVLERKAPPTFDVVVEMIEMDQLAIHHDVGLAVDELLRGNEVPYEVRSRLPDGQVVREKRGEELLPRVRSLRIRGVEVPPPETEESAAEGRFRIYTYGISRDRMDRAIHELRLPATITKDWKDADAIITLRAHQKRFKNKVQARGDVPTYYVRANTYSQVYGVLREVFSVTDASLEERALEEARKAVAHVMNFSETIELSPQNAYLRRLQHQLAESFQLNSRSVGREPHRRVVISQAARG